MVPSPFFRGKPGGVVASDGYCSHRSFTCSFSWEPEADLPALDVMQAEIVETDFFTVAQFQGGSSELIMQKGGSEANSSFFLLG
jgi:hypothetical protein